MIPALVGAGCVHEVSFGSSVISKTNVAITASPVCVSLHTRSVASANALERGEVMERF